MVTLFSFCMDYSIIILIGCDFSRNALKRQAFGSAAFLFSRFVV
nr:MAG TPA: Alpha-2,3-sialyltransferase [Caudoviricetes sp.]